MGCFPGKKKGEKAHLNDPGNDEENEFITPDADDNNDKHHKKHNVLRAYASVHTSDGTCGKHHKRGKEKDKVKLLVTIKEATDLRDADFIGQSDPYCIMEIADGKHRPKVHERTATIDDTKDPQWNHRFECRSAPGDTLTFTIWDKDMMMDELLGRCSLEPDKYYPFGYNGQLQVRNSSGDLTPAQLAISVKILEKPPEHAADETIPDDEKYRGAGLWAGMNFEDDNLSWRRAHDLVNCKEDEMGMQKEETNTSSIETLMRIAESGLPMPKHAMERLTACLHAADKRYRLAALMICKALGSRCLMFENELAILLHDKDDDVQAGVIRIIATFGGRAMPYIDDIGHYLHDEVPVVRTAALEALGIMSQADNFDALVVLGNEGLIHEDKRFRLATVLILKSFGVKATPHAYSMLHLIEDDPSVDVRIAACQTLGCLGVGAASVKEAISALYIVEHDQDPRVARAATMSLEKLQTQGIQLPKRPKEGIGSEAPKPKPKAKAKPKVRAKSKAVHALSPRENDDHGHKDKKDRRTHKEDGHKDKHEKKDDGHKDKKDKKGLFSWGKKDKDKDKDKHKDKDKEKHDDKKDKKEKKGWFKKKS